MSEQPFSRPDTACVKDLVCMAKAGNQEAFAKICESYTPFISGRAGRYSDVIGADVEDFIQEGRLALYRAVKGYDLNSGVQFRTYAVTCINNSMVSAIKRYMHGLQNRDSMPLDALDEPRMALRAWQCKGEEPEERLIQMEARQSRSDAMRRVLSPLEQNVLDCYLAGLPYHEIACELKTTEKAVDNALQRVRRKLRKKL